MKTILLAVFVALFQSWISAAEGARTLPPELQAAGKLEKDGNRREAADAFAVVARSGAAADVRAEALKRGAALFNTLEMDAEAEKLLEEMVSIPSQDWRVLTAAGLGIRGMDHYGSMEGNEFKRGQVGGNSWTSSEERDRIRSLQILLAARAKMPGDAEPADRGELLISLLQAWLGEGQGGPAGAWRFTILTDVKTLPEFTRDRGERTIGGQASGFPVTEDGAPLVFKLPKDFASAANDGERLRLAIHEWGEIGPANRLAAKGMWATIVRQWFSVSQAANFFDSDDDADRQKMQRDSLAAVHTLSDDETVALLATGPKRITLPPDYRFMTMLRDVSAVPTEPGEVYGSDAGLGKNWLRGYRDERIGELMQRCQFPQASTELREAMAKEKDLDFMKRLAERIEQIEGKWGRFETVPPQPAGVEAKIPLVFRNATQVDCVARRVDVQKLVASMLAEAKAGGADSNLNYNLGVLGHRLLKDDAANFLIGDAVEWSRKLTPAPNHWDTRTDLTTPLKEGGAYFVEAEFNGEHPTRTLVWVESMTLVRTDLADDWHYFACDAVTGAPLPKAKLEFYGFRADWRRDRRVYDFKTFTAKTDAQGVAKIGKQRLEEFEWIVLASSADGKSCFQETSYAGYRRDQSADAGYHQQDSLYAFTDRPVYRPGQEVKWQVWARRSGYDPKLDTNPFAQRKVKVEITDARGQKVAEKPMRFDDWGTLTDTLMLAPDAALGVYQASVSIGNDGPNWGFQFRVEEYKKPEFEVKVVAPEKPVALGETFEFTIKADYYFGGPVKEAKVKYTVKRKAHHDRWYPVGRWDWLFGSGYGWQSRTYDWYPGAGRWCICFPPWRTWGYDPEELVLEGEGPIGADGQLKVKVDTSLAKELHGNEDHAYDISATVTDSSRRNIDGKGTVIAARRPFEVYAWMDKGYYRVGEKAEARFNARTLDGTEVKAAGTLKVMQVTYDDAGKPSEKQVHEQAIKTDGQAVVFQWPAAGQYRVEILLKEDGDRQAETSVFVTVRGDVFDGKGYRYDDLELLTEKDEYQPGDEVELVINTNREGATVALFIYGDRADPVYLTLPGKSMAYQFKLREADQPSMNLSAYTVSNAVLHQVKKQIIIPPSKRIASVELIPNKTAYLPRDKASTKVRVKDQLGQPFVGKVALTAYDKSLEYISGGSNAGDVRTAFWGWNNSTELSIASCLKVSDVLSGKEGEVGMTSLSSTDRFLPGFGALSFSGSGDAMSAKAPVMAPAPPAAGAERRLFKRSAGMVPASAAPAAPAAMAMVGGAAPASEAAAAPVMIRSNLADSAVWVASVTTNEAGEASVDFDMPDNLTTWKFRSWVLGKDAQVGEAAVEVVTRKNLMVRLQAPRFFVERDEVVISANVHNETDAPLVVRPELDVEPKLLTAAQPDGDRKAPITIPAHGEKRVDWRMRVSGAGEVKLTAKALSETESDAMQMTFPVFEHGMLKTDSRSLALRSDQPSGRMKFTVPEDRKPEASRLDIRWSPTLAMACIDALPYLADYPYGCTEQTLNKFVPTVITLNILKGLEVDLKTIREKRVNLNAQEVGDAKERSKRWQQKDRHNEWREAVYDESRVQNMARAGLRKLRDMRNDDGGWGWFPGGKESSPHITALVLHGLLAAKRAGMDVDEEMLSTTWLERHEQEELARMKLDPKNARHKSSTDNTDALIHAVLVEAGAGSDAMRAALYEQRNNLSRLNVGLLGLACNTKNEVERRDMCLRNLRQFLKQDEENQTAWLDLPNNGWWFWWGDEMETQAVFLRLLSATEPKGELAASMAKYLLNNRRNGTYWNSTRDTATIIEALAEYAVASGETKPELEVEIKLDGEVVKTAQITAETLFTSDNSFVLEGDAVTSGEHTVEIVRKGAGPLYANAYLTVYTKEDNIPAAGLEVKVERRYFKVTEAKQKANVSNVKGQATQQTGTREVRTELASGDLLKSGDQVEVELIVESKNDYEYVLLADPKPAGFEAVDLTSGWVYEGLSAYREFRDEKVAFFADRLPQGRHVMRYRVRAEVPGKFSALPAKAEAMYAQELRGNAAEWKAVIGE